MGIRAPGFRLSTSIQCLFFALLCEQTRRMQLQFSTGFTHDAFGFNFFFLFLFHVKYYTGLKKIKWGGRGEVSYFLLLKLYGKFPEDMEFLFSLKGQNL